MWRPSAAFTIFVVSVFAVGFSSAELVQSRGWLAPPSTAFQHAVFAGHCQAAPRVGEGSQCDIFSQRLCRYPLVCSRGLCVKPTLGQPCKNNEHCSDSESCQEGKCGSVLGDGDPCASNLSCASGVCEKFFCKGLDDGEECDSKAEGNPCQSGSYCAASGKNKNKCTRSAKEGDNCFLDANVHTRANLLDICGPGLVCDASQGTFSGVCTRISSYSAGDTCGRVFGAAVCQAGLTCAKAENKDGTDGVCEEGIGRECTSTSDCPRNAECVCAGAGDKGICRAVMKGACEGQMQGYIECIQGNECSNSVAWRGFGSMIHGSCALECKEKYKELLCCQTEGYWRPLELSCDPDAATGPPNEWKVASVEKEAEGGDGETEAKEIDKLNEAASAVEQAPVVVVKLPSGHSTSKSTPEEDEPENSGVKTVAPIGHTCHERKPECHKHKPRKVPNGHLGMAHRASYGSMAVLFGKTSGYATGPDGEVVYEGKFGPLHRVKYDGEQSINVPATKKCPPDGGPECSGHGECMQLTGMCNCEEGWGSEDCSMDTAEQAKSLFNRENPENAPRQIGSYGERLFGENTVDPAEADNSTIVSAAPVSSSDETPLAVDVDGDVDAPGLSGSLLLIACIGMILIVATVLTIVGIIKVWTVGMNNRVDARAKADNLIPQDTA